MPREGSKTITVSDEKHRQALDVSEKFGITLKKYVEDLIGTIPIDYEKDSMLSRSLEVPVLE